MLPIPGISKYDRPGDQIKMGDFVVHGLSKLVFKCENKKQERWMNMNPYYIKIQPAAKSTPEQTPIQ
jgi:hypothetical protein